MQQKTTKKIIIDATKLETLLRLGCPEKVISEYIIHNTLNRQKDELINTILESLIDRKTFSNWGGNHNPSGKNQHNNNKLGQVDLGQVVVGQVVDKDKDKDKDKEKNRENINKRYGECKNVLLTEEQYLKLSKEKENFQLALEKLDTWLGTSGSKNRNKNHFAYFKSNSWVWQGLKTNEITF